MPTTPLFSVITPSAGRRPKALAQAIRSVEAALAASEDILSPGALEMLVGFDGVKGLRPLDLPFVRYFDLPADNNYGNGVRNTLLKVARGRRIIFLDDDNALLPDALRAYMTGAAAEAEMVIARIDCSRAFSEARIPRFEPEAADRPLVRPGNVDSLCVCASRELVATRCGGWSGEAGYEADYANILKYFRRARSATAIENVVGVYDAGAGLDVEGINWRQARGPSGDLSDKIDERPDSSPPTRPDK